MGQFKVFAVNFWIQYMDRVWLLLQFLQATKNNNSHLHVSCLKNICPLLFCMNHHNYAKYLSVYFVSVTNLIHSHLGTEEMLQDNGFHVSRSSMPAGRTAVNKTIEQTINKHAKTKGGIDCGIQQKFTKLLPMECDTTQPS